jgi:NAD(P)-dependent dehydrogenase (short-subunit alcohol dehydrogenase family)
VKVSFDFSGCTVFVAGAASGIGRAAAIGCAQAGAHVVAVDVDAPGLATLAGERIVTAVVDIAESQTVDAVVRDTKARTGRIDAAILTSAIQQRSVIEEVTDAQWQRHLDVNLSGIFYCLRALFPIMKAQRSGAIVTFTSGLANSGWPGAAAYAATKAGIVGLTKSAALELRPFGVRINALSPGLVATPVFLQSASDDELAMYERTLGVSAPDEVVPTLMHLISDGAASISGNVVERRLIPRVSSAD